MKKIVLSLKHLIVLIWLFLVLLIFKITTNFKFKNGSSLVFVGLLIIVPLFVYIYSYIWSKKIRKQNKSLSLGYYTQIEKDVKTQKFQNNFLTKVKELGLEYKFNDQKDRLLINIYNNDFEIMNIDFTGISSNVQIVNTNIVYHFYYSNQIDEFTKYDLRNFEYKETTVLYTKILELLEKLINQEYTYTQSKKQKTLVNSTTKEIIYDVKLNKKLYKYYKKEIKQITL